MNCSRCDAVTFVVLYTNRTYRLIAIISVVTFLQGCAFATPIDVLNGLDALSRLSTSPSPSYEIRCEPVENSASLLTSDAGGTYLSEITGKKDYLDARQGSLIVRMSRNGNRIEGAFGSFGGEIEGTVDGETITFDWYSSWTHGIGEWQINAGSNDLTGTWKTTGGYEGSGKWNLKECLITSKIVE